MKIKQVSTEGGSEGLYVVEEISSNDIAPPSEAFTQFIQELKGLAFLDGFNMDSFMDQVRRKYTSSSDSSPKK